MARDKKKPPSILTSGGPPELQAKKEKDWFKGRWKSEQARLRQPKKLLIVVDLAKALTEDVVRKKYPRLHFEPSNNQFFTDMISYKVNGTKDELMNLLTSEDCRLKPDRILEVYPELK